MDTETLGNYRLLKYFSFLIFFVSLCFFWLWDPMAFGSTGSIGSSYKVKKANQLGDRGFEIQVAWMGPENGERLSATGQGGCYNEAYRLLPRDESLELCSDASSLETALCFKKAIEMMPKQAALRLCKGRGSRRSVACIEAANQLLPGEAAIALCSQGGDPLAAECFSEASKTLSTGQALRLCSGGTGAQDRFLCYSQATLRFGVEFALEACDLH